VREAYDAPRQPLLVAVELADLHLRPEFAIGDIEPGERDGLLQDRRTGGAGVMYLAERNRKTKPIAAVQYYVCYDSRTLDFCNWFS
jgi:hypothetical protein